MTRSGHGDERGGVPSGRTERRADVRLHARRQRQLRDRPGGGRADLRRARRGRRARHRPAEPALPRPRGPLPGPRGGDQAVPRHRDRTADHGERARGGQGGGAGQSRRLRRQRSGGDLARGLHAARRRGNRDRRPRPPGSGRDYRRRTGPFGAQLRPAGRGAARRDLAFRGRRRRSGPDRRRLDDLVAAGQLPGDLAPVGRPLRGGGQARRRLPGRVVGAVPAEADGGAVAVRRAPAGRSRRSGLDVAVAPGRGHPAGRLARRGVAVVRDRAQAVMRGYPALPFSPCLTRGLRELPGAGGASGPPRRGRPGAGPSPPWRCCWRGGPGWRCRRWWWTGRGG